MDTECSEQALFSDLCVHRVSVVEIAFPHERSQRTGASALLPHARSNPRSVPLPVLNWSVSMPRRWSMET